MRKQFNLLNFVIPSICTFIMVLYSMSASASEPIKVILPYPAGGGVDAVFRVLQQYASKKSVTLIPEYKNGAQGQVGITHFSRFPSTGNSIMLTTISDVSKWNSRNSDSSIIPVTAIVDNVFVVVVGKDSKVNVFMDSLKPSNMLTWGIGSTKLGDLTNNIIIEMNGDLQNVITIPFNGANALIPNIVGGHIDIAVLPASTVMPLIDSGMLRVVAAWNNDHTFKDALNLPKVINNTEMNDGYGIFLPSGSGDENKKYWAKFISEFLKDPETQYILSHRYLRPLPQGEKYINSVLMGS